MKKIIILTIALLSLTKAYSAGPVNPITPPTDSTITKVKEIIASAKGSIPFDLDVEMSFVNSLQNNRNSIINNPILTSIFNVINPIIQADVKANYTSPAGQSLMSEVIGLIKNHNEQKG